MLSALKKMVQHSLSSESDPLPPVKSLPSVGICTVTNLIFMVKNHGIILIDGISD